KPEPPGPKLRAMSTGRGVCHDAPPVARWARANGSRLRRRAAGRPRRVPGRRTGQGRHEPSRVRRADPAHRRDLRARPRRRGRSGADLRRSREGDAPQQHVARAALRRGPRRAATRAPLLGGAVLRPDGAHPDHVASVLTAFAAWRQFFARGGARFGDNVVRFYERARDEDLYLTYAIVPPQVDRSQP